MTRMEIFNFDGYLFVSKTISRLCEKYHTYYIQRRDFRFVVNIRLLAKNIVDVTFSR